MAATQNNFGFLTTNLAYKIHSDKHLDFKKQNNDSNWEILCKSSDSIGTNQHAYKSIAFINRVTKEVHIATAGTKPNQLFDLIDDLCVVLGMVPYKMLEAKNMVNKVIDLLGGTLEAKNYQFSTSGHSLGAIISDLTAIELISQDLIFNKSTTFENPGSKNIIERAIKKDCFSQKVITPIEKLKEHFLVFNAKPNFINTTNSQFGTTKLVLNDESKICDKKTDNNGSIWQFGKYLCNKIGSTIKSCADYLGVSSILKQIQDHSLKNFSSLEKDSTIVNTQDWQQVEKKLIIEKNRKLENMTSTGDDVLMFYEENCSSFLKINKSEFSYNDLLRSNKYHEDNLDLLGNQETDCGDAVIIF